MADRKSIAEKWLTLREDHTLDLGQFHLTATSLEVRGNPVFGEWEKCGSFLDRIEGAVQFWIGDWLNYGEKAYGEKYAQAVSPTQAETWQHYAWVSNSVESCIRIQDLSYSHHLQVAKIFDRLEPDPAVRAKQQQTQSELLQQAAPLPGETAPQLTVSEFKALVRSRLHNEKTAAIAAGTLPTGVYDVICADPPWAYDNSGFDQSAAEHYPTMPVEQIADLPVTDDTFPKFAEDCALFLWATSPLLPEAVRVLQAWGFDYKASLVWEKPKAPAIGWWVHTRHELLLIGQRGSCVPLHKPDSIISAAVTKHSRKPSEAYGVIEAMYPDVRRVELFARQPRPGWDVWGNEV